MNKQGLSRNIPNDIKRKIRLASGFGCVVCGFAIYQYEHVMPDFADAESHDPNAITLLCATCHDQVTRGIWSKDKVVNAMRNPRTKQAGYSRFQLDIDSESNLLVQIGNKRFGGVKDIILIDSFPILSIRPPEESNSPPLINASFYDQNGDLIAQIIDNEWHGSTSTFDIEAVGNRISIRNTEKKIDLEVTVQTPNGIAVEKLFLRYRGKEIMGDSQRGYEVKTTEAAVRIEPEDEEIVYAPHWLSITDDKISVGSDRIINLTRAEHRSAALPGTTEVEGARWEKVDTAKEGIPLPPGARPGHKVFKFTKLSDTGKPGMVSFNIPVNRTSTASESRKSEKVGRNDPCPCGSGLKYKKCHGRT